MIRKKQPEGEATLFDEPQQAAPRNARASRKAPPAAEPAEGAGEGAKNGAPRKPVKGAPREHETAQTLATKQRDISVSEFFTKNRHLLGFDSPLKALLTARQGGGRQLARRLRGSRDPARDPGRAVPDERATAMRMVVEDNGPGIVEAQIGKVFGKLLYGSKFHKLSQSRGQQGIGISAAGMYGQLTTGKPMRIVSRAGQEEGRARVRAHHRHAARTGPTSTPRR